MGHPDDAALGLPLVMTGSDSTRRLDTLTGTKPGGANDAASPTDGASLSQEEAAHRACLETEDAAFKILLASLTTSDQFRAVSAYHEAVFRTRCARIDLEFARRASLINRMAGKAPQ